MKNRLNYIYGPLIILAIVIRLTHLRQKCNKCIKPYADEADELLQQPTFRTQACFDMSYCCSLNNSELG